MSPLTIRVPQKISLVIFDKDGVLILTEEGKTKSYWQGIDMILPGFMDWPTYKQIHPTGRSRADVLKYLLQKIPRLAPALEEIFLEGLGINFPQVRKELRKILSKKFQTSDPESYQEVRDEVDGVLAAILSVCRMMKYVRMPLPERCQRNSDASDFLLQLQEAGIPTALITESKLDRTKSELAHFKININSFIAVGCKDYMYPGEEPSPGEKKLIYAEIAEKADVPLDECLTIEDTQAGIDEAVRAGIGCIIGYLREGGQLRGTTLNIQSFHELAILLE